MFKSLEHPNKALLANLTIFLAISCSATALYLPFLSNELIFDDVSFFFGGIPYSRYAITPFDFAPRTLPFFSFAFIQATTQSFEVQRLVNLGLHCINAYLVFLTCRTLIVTPGITGPKKEFAPEDSHTLLLCTGIALIFTIHPVAVYGVGYLVQRTILFATFFSLLTLLKLLEAIRTNSWAAIFWAAIFSIGAIYSKEHAIALPIAVATVFLAFQSQLASGGIKRIATYLLICVPAMIWLIYCLRSTIAAPYEMHAPIYLQNDGEGLWLRSALSQCSLYFQYLRLWVLPDTALMSIDFRVPFPEHWSAPGAVLGGLAFLLAGATSLYCILRTTRFRMFGIGLIYTQILFLVELSTVRVQEPFVLYRSYLWAPGFLFMGLNLAQGLSRRYLLVALALTLPVLGYQSVNRLESMSSGLSAWTDAQSKLSNDDLPGAFRIYYNRGVQYLRVAEYDLALTDFVTCNRLNLSYAGCLSGQAAAQSQKKNYAEALIAIESALQIDPKNPSAWESKGKILEALGRRNDAARAFAEAEARGGSIGTILRRGRLPKTESSNPQ